MATVESEASDPRTSGARLQQICSTHPDLQATVANNPNTYPALLAWLGEYGTPQAKAVVAARNAEPVQLPAPAGEPETTDAVPEPQLEAEAEAEAELVEAFSEPQLEPEPLERDVEPEPELTEVTLEPELEPEPVENPSETEPVDRVAETETESAPETVSSTLESELTEFISTPTTDSVETEVMAVTDQAPPQGPAVPLQPPTQTLPATAMQGATPPPVRTSRMPAQPTSAFAPISSTPPGAGQAPQRTSVFPATTQAPGFTQGPTPPAQQVAPEQKKSAGIWLIPVAALVILVVVAALVWFFFFRSAPDQGASVIIPSEVTQEAVEREDEAEEATPEEEEEEIEEAEQADDSEIEGAEQDEPAPFPAPSNAVTATWFTSESANIACEMTSGAVTCTIYEHEYQVTSGGCSSGPITIVLGSGPAQWDCSVGPVSNTAAPVLEYSTSSTVDDFSCLSTAQGMSCWNHFTGDAFALAKAGWVDVRNNGVVTPSQMYWID